MRVNSSYRKLEAYLDTVQASGRYYFTSQEVRDKLSLTTGSFRKQLLPLLLKNQIALIRNGFYVIVAPEYRAVGAPPVTYYIEGLMKVLNRPYYIGLLNAAAWYGAAHQQPQNYSIITLTPALPDIKKEYARIDFICKNRWDDRDIVQQKTNAGYVNASSPELTAFDLCYYSKHAGGINQVATVLQELVEELDGRELIDTAKRYSNMMAVQRTGYLLEFLGNQELVNPLKGWLKNQKYHAALLDVSNKDHSSKITGNDWRIIVNTEIDPS